MPEETIPRCTPQRREGSGGLCEFVAHAPMISRIPPSRCPGVDPSGSAVLPRPVFRAPEPGKRGPSARQGKRAARQLRTEARRGNRHRGARGTGWLRRRFCFVLPGRFCLRPLYLCRSGRSGSTRRISGSVPARLFFALVPRERLRREPGTVSGTAANLPARGQTANELLSGGRAVSLKNETYPLLTSVTPLKADSTKRSMAAGTGSWGAWIPARGSDRKGSPNRSTEPSAVRTEAADRLTTVPSVSETVAGGHRQGRRRHGPVSPTAGT